MEETAVAGVAEPSSNRPAERQPLLDLVELWWADHFPGSPVAQVTPAWNHAFAAKEELKRLLKEDK